MRTPSAISRLSAVSGVPTFLSRSGAFADKAQICHCNTVNLDLSSSDRGPVQESLSPTIAAGLSRAVLNGYNVFGVNCEWPAAACCTDRLVRVMRVPPDRIVRRDRADRTGVSVLTVLVGPVLTELKGSTYIDRLTCLSGR